jgi:hypothetical protein
MAWTLEFIQMTLAEVTGTPDAKWEYWNTEYNSVDPPPPPSALQSDDSLAQYIFGHQTG